MSRNAGMGPRMIDGWKPEGAAGALKDMGFGRRMLDDAPQTVAEAKAAENAEEPRHDATGPAGPEDHASSADGSQQAPSPAGDPSPPVLPAPADQKGYSTAEVKQLATEAPGRIPELLNAEINRPDGPRKTALRHLLTAAEKDGNPTVVRGVGAVLEAVAQAVG